MTYFTTSSVLFYFAAVFFIRRLIDKA